MYRFMKPVLQFWARNFGKKYKHLSSFPVACMGAVLVSEYVKLPQVKESQHTLKYYLKYSKVISYSR